MRHILKVAAYLLICCACIAVYWRGAPIASAQQSQDCKVVTEGLSAANELRIGMLRSDLEKNFEPDGGISFPRSGTYTYKKCAYIKLDVEFDALKFDKNMTGFSKKDPITRISKPYLAYPSRD